VHRVTSQEFGDLAERVAAVYVECFAAEPWNEVFSAEEVTARLQEVLMFNDSILLVARGKGEVFGATLHYPLHYNKQVSHAVAPEHLGAMYCEELFVSRTHHRRGIGGRLFDIATGVSMALGYERRILRTAPDYVPTVRFYTSRGYRPIGFTQCRSKKRVGGDVKVQVDSRVVMLQETPGTWSRS
jgi:predicted N-acetyltransferase YhbS